ncbi:hypothetical protein ABW20_dc0109125 [Dactylellina cionopaga]|nr:hypothetical protein ABW20_dc0109125 [Dactylellina cionopaga]
MISKIFSTVAVTSALLILCLSGVDARPAKAALLHQEGTLNARDKNQNPAYVFRNLTSRGVDKRHPYTEEHFEVLISDRWPGTYNEAFHEIYGQYIINSADNEPWADRYFGEQLTMRPNDCRPFFFSCDLLTYLEVCNFGSEKIDLKGRDIWMYAERMMAAVLPDTFPGGMTYADYDVFKTNNPKFGPHLNYLKIPTLYQIDTTMIGYTYKSTNPDLGVAWYYMNPKPRDVKYLAEYGVKCVYADKIDRGRDPGP